MKVLALVGDKVATPSGAGTVKFVGPLIIEVALDSGFTVWSVPAKTTLVSFAAN